MAFLIMKNELSFGKELIGLECDINFIYSRSTLGEHEKKESLDYNLAQFFFKITGKLFGTFYNPIF